MSDYKYCAFISYRHLVPDKIIAKKLHTAIETYHFPASIKKEKGKKRMGKVFRDAEELPLCSDLGADIEDALNNSEWFIAICSPQYQKSMWCMRELEYFVSRHGIDHVLAVLVSGTPEESFPEILYHKQKKTGEMIIAEPLAADVRAHNISKSLHLLKNEKLRLFASMLSVSYDDLKRRARQRRIRIGVSIASATLAVALGLTTYVIANNKRAEALRTRAEEQRLQALVEKKNAANRSIGELLERARFYYEKDERRQAAKSLLDAVAISDDNDYMRKEEILSLLRRAMLIAPFSQIASLSNEDLRLTDLTVSSDEKFCIGIENGNTVVLVDLITNETRLRVTANHTEINYIEFSPDGERFLALCGGGRFVQVWNTSDGSPVFSYYSEKNTSRQIANAFFWGDSDKLFVQDWDKFYIVSSDNTKTLFYTKGDQQEEFLEALHNTTAASDLTESYNEHFEDYMGMDVIISSNKSKILVSGMLGETAPIILDNYGKKICLLKGALASQYDKYTFSPDEKLVSSISIFGVITTWNAESGDQLYSYYAIQEPATSKKISRIAFSPDGSRIAYVFDDTLEILDAYSGNIIAIRSFPDDISKIPSICFSKNGNYLFITYEHMFFLDAWDGSQLSVLTGDPSYYYDYCVPLNNMVLIARAGMGSKVYSMPAFSSVYSTESFDYELCPPYNASALSNKWATIPEGSHKIDDAYINTLSNMQVDSSSKSFFSQNGEIAALTYPDGTIEIYKLDGDGSTDAVIKPFAKGIWAQWYSSLAMNDKYLVASNVEQLVIYNIGSKTVEKNIFSSLSYERFAFENTGKMFMAMGTGGYGISVYDFETGDELLFIGGNEHFTDIAFSLDGAYAVGITDHGYTVCDLLLDETDLLSRAHQLVEAK